MQKILVHPYTQLVQVMDLAQPVSGSTNIHQFLVDDQKLVLLASVSIG